VIRQQTFTLRTDGRGTCEITERVALTTNSLTIPCADGRLLLGTWQGIFVWEHRLSPHARTVVVTVQGE
jgi:secondary thiamine-phosphate synthase enzyme